MSHSWQWSATPTAISQHSSLFYLSGIFNVVKLRTAVGVLVVSPARGFTPARAPEVSSSVPLVDTRWGRAER